MNPREKSYLAHRRTCRKFNKIGVGYASHRIDKSVFDKPHVKGTYFQIPNYFIDENRNPIPRTDGKPPIVNCFFIPSTQQ